MQNEVLPTTSKLYFKKCSARYNKTCDYSDYVVIAPLSAPWALSQSDFSTASLIYNSNLRFKSFLSAPIKINSSNIQESLASAFFLKQAQNLCCVNKVVRNTSGILHRRLSPAWIRKPKDPKILILTCVTFSNFRTTNFNDTLKLLGFLRGLQPSESTFYAFVLDVCLQGRTGTITQAQNLMPFQNTTQIMQKHLE